MATNDLNSILDGDGNRALVEKYLEKKFLERRNYDTVLANSEYAQRFSIPEGGGDYVEASRKGTFRRPQNVANASLTSDPASGASMAMTKIKLPLEWIQEFIPISTLTQSVTWVDLEDWANEDLPLALMRRRHELVQNAFKVGRYTPGVWAANGTASTAFDTTPEATVTIAGVSFTFKTATANFVAGKKTFTELASDDRFTMDDFIKAHARLALAGTPKVNGKYVASISDSIKQDVMKDDRYFRAAVEAFSGKGLAENVLADYMGWHWVMDDEPFTETWGAPLVRATNGEVHTACVFGKSGFAYLKLGASNPGAKPRFKVQDITKTGVEKTIGYVIPNQVGILDETWTMTLTGPVSVAKPNGA
jgi:hypothetical protein